MKSKSMGVTLLEIILVLAIGASIIVLGMRLYLIFKKDSDVRILQFNVDTLFQQASMYYRGQCIRGMDPDTGPVDPSTPSPATGMGQLDPIPGTVSTSTPVVVDYQTTLKALGGFPLGLSPLVDNSDPALSYIVQLMPVTVSGSLPRRVVSISPDTLVNPPGVGYIFRWRILVAVKMKTTALATAYKNYMSATCISNKVGNYVQGCDAPVAGQYLVWERLPSFATPTGISDYWVSNPLTNQFKQMYTTYPIIYLTGTSTSLATSQYYLCGG